MAERRAQQVLHEPASQWQFLRAGPSASPARPLARSLSGGTLPAEDGKGLEALVRYMMRPPVSLSRRGFTPGSHEVVYARKGGHDEP